MPYHSHIDNKRMGDRGKDLLLIVDMLHLLQSDDFTYSHDLQSKEVPTWEVFSEDNSAKRACAYKRENISSDPPTQQWLPHQAQGM